MTGYESGYPVLGCEICGDQNFSQHSGIARMYGEDVLVRSFLEEDSGVYLTPAPGTITAGYLIAAPRRHVLSVAAMNNEELMALERLIARVRRTGRINGLSEYVVFEHGMTSTSHRGAACLDHAHLHLCPSPDPRALRDYLRKWYAEDEFESWTDLSSLSDDKESGYILLSHADNNDVSEKLYVYRVSFVASQLVRQRLAIQWGTPNEWDWRAFPHRDKYLETLKMFELCERRNG